jgi:hypothetical protein
MERAFDYVGGALGGGIAVLGGLASGFVLFSPDVCTLIPGNGVECVNMLGWDVFGMVGTVPIVVAVAGMTFLIGIGMAAYRAISASGSSGME